MLVTDRGAFVMNDQAIERLTARVIEALRSDLGALVAELLTPAASEQLTVGQVATRLGFTRATVYAHWHEWGGYKLGTGDRAAIRFDGEALPATATRVPVARRTLTERTSANRSRQRTRTRDLLVDKPRFAEPLDGVA
jgi:hypothetical protein